MRGMPLLLALLACTRPGDAPRALSDPQAKRCATSPGEPLPSDCRGETRPVTSGVVAACIARRAIPTGLTAPSGETWHYAVTFRDSRWLVTVHDPDACAPGGGYLIQIDPKSGRILR